jgi:hypothetical protein
VLVDGLEALVHLLLHGLEAIVHLKHLDSQASKSYLVTNENVFLMKLLASNRKGEHGSLFVFDSEGEYASTGIIKEGDVTEKDESTGPIMNNLVTPIRNLHDPDSKLRHVLEIAVSKGYPVIIDISLMDSYTALQFCSIVISYFFNKNQKAFTDESEPLARIVFAVEEAQSVLGMNSNASSFVELAKEGRKYQLDGVFITQQPGSIMPEILSQADNFFVFHMISKNDLLSLQKTNAHYSDDVLTQLLNEPVQGKCYMWSSPQPFVLPVKVTYFDETAKTYAAREIQSKVDLLGPILSAVISIDDTKKRILEKVKQVMKEHGVDAADPANISEKRNYLTTGLFNKMADEEKSYVQG